MFNINWPKPQAMRICFFYPRRRKAGKEEINKWTKWKGVKERLWQLAMKLRVGRTFGSHWGNDRWKQLHRPVFKLRGNMGKVHLKSALGSLNICETTLFFCSLFPFFFPIFFLLLSYMYILNSLGYLLLLIWYYRFSFFLRLVHPSIWTW